MSAVDLAHLAQLLREGYAASGDVRLARAAAELSPRRGRGRRTIDDTSALARMEALLVDPELTVWGAALIVAGELGERQAQRRSVAARLAAKWRRAREMGGRGRQIQLVSCPCRCPGANSAERVSNSADYDSESI